MTPKITILMPSLNVRKFIEQCMESVVNQTLNDIEVICIDAGSTDGTTEVLREYESRDSRVRVIISDQKSYGHQLNLGLKVAQGDYIGIVETDDWVEPNMFETLWTHASNNEADVVKCNYYWHYTNAEESDKPFENLSGCRYNTVFRPMQDRTLFTTTPAIWSGIYRREFVDSNGILFNETPGASYQDTSFHFMVCTCAQRAYLIDEYLHHYRKDNETSSVNSRGKVFCVCDEMHYFETFLENRPQVKDAIYDYYISLKYEKYRWNFDRLSPQDQWAFLETFNIEFAQHFENGNVQRRFYEADVWDDVRLVSTSPVSYFRKRCKAYATRPIGSKLPGAEVIHSAKVNNPLVSIIIPMFNVAKYVRKTVESALAQSMDTIEVICVDDGSTDETLAILLDYARNPKIHILHQENEGQSAARNHALNVATGDYVIFLDGDDALRSDAVAALYDKSIALGTDVIYFDGQSVFDSPVLREKYPYYIDGYQYPMDIAEPISGIEFFCQAKKDNKYRVSACMAFYKRDFLVTNDIRFIEGILHEDNAFTFECLMNAGRVWHTTEQYYLRSVHDDSTMTRGKTFVHLYGLLTCIDRLQELSASIAFDERFHEAFSSEIYSLITQLCSTYDQLDNTEECWLKLSEVEKEKLNVYLGYAAFKDAQRQLEQMESRERDIVGSISFKTGRLLTFPLRKARGAFRAVRDHGISYAWDKVVGRDPEWTGASPRVLFISSDAYRMSGAFLSLIALNRELHNAFGEETHVILPYYGSGNEIMTAAGISWTVIQSRDWIVPIDEQCDREHVLQKDEDRIVNLRAAIDIARFALDNGYNVIHSNTSYTYVGALAAKLAGLPHIWHLREFLEEDQNNQFDDKRYAASLLNQADSVIAISEALREKYERLVGPSRIRTIYNGVDDVRFYRPSRSILKNDVPIFLFVSGSSSPHKGRIDLIEACEVLKQRGQEFELWFVGWCGHALQQAVRARQLTSCTKFFGYQKDTESFYEKADIFFMCSRFEAFGRTTVEAGMAGCLVIGSNSGGTAELVEDGETGLLYECGNSSDLANVIEKALSDKDRSKRIASSGREHFYSCFTARRNAELIYELHNEVVHRARPHSAITHKAAKARIKLEAGRHRLLRDCLLPRIQKDLKELVASQKGESVQSKFPSPSFDPAEDSLPKVSIVIPVYNVENYLRQCLDSVISQTLSSIEIICVNDGSTDASGQILEEYAERDDRITVINKPNSGYGASVNLGMRDARGEYLAIVEPDDFIAPDMYAKLYEIAASNGYIDIVKSSYWLYFDEEDGGGRIEEAPIVNACHPPKKVFEVWDYPEIIYHHPSIWSCIYRNEFIKSESIEFVEAPGAGWVDNPFLIKSFCLAETISWTSESYYYYRQTNPGASSHIKDCSMPFMRTGEMLEFLDDNGIEDPAIRGSVYKRILYNAAAALDNPAYLPERDDEIIVTQIRRISPSFLKEPRVREVERHAYGHFMGK